MNNGGEILFSVPVSVKNKKEMIDMFETLAHFPDTVMMLRNGDNTVDAHSLMGFFAIDEKIPIELLLESNLMIISNRRFLNLLLLMHKNNIYILLSPMTKVIGPFCLRF